VISWIRLLVQFLFVNRRKHGNTLFGKYKWRGSPTTM
jgi:hypothetical protein